MKHVFEQFVMPPKKKCKLMTLCTAAFSYLLSNQRSWSLSSRKLLLTLRSWKTTGQCWTSPSRPNPWESCFPPALQPSVDQQSILISQLIVPVIAPRQPFSRSSMTFSLLLMKTKSLSCLCVIYPLPLMLLTTPFFCHVLVTLLVYLGSLPISLIAPKLSL